MIEISAVATHDQDEASPICLTVYAQGQMDELRSFAQRVGMALVIPNWNGRPLAAAEILLQDTEQAYAKASSLLSLIEQKGEKVKWITDFVPGMVPTYRTLNNTYETRDDFMKALKDCD